MLALQMCCVMLRSRCPAGAIVCTCCLGGLAKLQVLLLLLLLLGPAWQRCCRHGLRLALLLVMVLPAVAVTL